MNLDQSKGLYLEEARDLLSRAETALLQLEDRPGDMDLINEVFRALHTVKGSGAMFGFQAVADFTHDVENLFDEVRKGRLEINSDVIEIGLQAVDHIGRLLDNQEDPAVAELIAEGIAQLHDEPSLPREPKPKTIPEPGVSAPLGARRYRIRFTPQPSLLSRGVKLEALWADLASLGPIRMQVNTDRVPTLETLEPQEIYLSWTVDLETDKPESEIRFVFIFVEDFAEIQIEPQGGANASDPVPASTSERPLPSAPKAAAPRSTETEPKAEASIRVRKDKLDKLVDTVGELVILQARLDQEARRRQEPGLLGISEVLERLTADLRDTTMSIRMVPLDELFTSFHRLVRDLGRSLQKDLNLEISGASTEIDKNIIDSLKDPLLHIIRNAADHGIETPEDRARAGKPTHGTITLSAGQSGSRVEISVGDDGAGLNLKKILAKAAAQNLLPSNETNEDRIRSVIFEPGFSTAAVTTELSGRGVGMDVVKRNIERLRGEVSVASVPGQGTTFVISIPLTLVIIEGLLVRVGQVDYIVPLGSVTECVDMTEEFLSFYSHQGVINLRGQTIPVIDLRKLLGPGGTYPGISRLVIASHMGMVVGLMVDSVQSKQQVVIKPLSSTIRSLKTVSGATILGDGSVALILDLGEIIKTKTAFEEERS